MSTTSFDERLEQVVGDVATRRFGALDRRALVRAVARVSDTYTRRRDRVDALVGDDAALAARLCFFLPRDLPKVGAVLRELALADALPASRRWRVLDLGAGLGTTTFGTARFAARTGAAQALEVTAVDRDERALAVLEDLARQTDAMGAVPVAVKPKVADVARLRPAELAGPFDLVVAGLFFNELAPPGGDDARWIAHFAESLAAWSETLAEDGALLVIEPALRETSRRLQSVRDRLAARPGRPHVFAPCVRSGPCPMLASPRDWCHTDLPGPLPARAAALAQEAGLRAERRTFSHLTLRRRPGSLARAAAGRPGRAHRLVSAPLRSKGKVEVVGCGEDGLVRIMRLDRHAPSGSEVLGQAVRGSLVTVEGGRARGARLRLDAADRVHTVGAGAPGTEADPDRG
ncbi:MAG: small ribosomal subunit Rsm22 family protein [Myxococcota bacterium]